VADTSLIKVGLDYCTENDTFDERISNHEMNECQAIFNHGNISCLYKDAGLIDFVLMKVLKPFKVEFSCPCKKAHREYFDAVGDVAIRYQMVLYWFSRHPVDHLLTI
ncbi:hypothetical protein HK096_008373, partial [Nowakowskiella sp. JEL0078]